MGVERSRITFLVGLAAVVIAGPAIAARADEPLAATVYKEPT